MYLFYIENMTLGTKIGQGKSEKTTSLSHEYRNKILKK